MSGSLLQLISTWPRKSCMAVFVKISNYHLAVLTINTPALRSRPSDIPLLIRYFLDSARKTLRRSPEGKIEKRPLAMLSTYGWPGNVRQLRHVAERLAATTSKKISTTVHDIHGALPEVTLTATAQVRSATTRTTHSISSWIESCCNFMDSYSQNG
jgi:sigma-54 dependent transcriptional regulator, acetoin dehydrogenase operon transcriptional activator AcoR